MAAGILALSLSACDGALGSPSPTPTSTLIAVPTQPAAQAGSPQACMAALLTGTLIADEHWGIAVSDADGRVVKVIWPYGFAARADGTRLVLVDAELGDAVIAHEGDRVEVGGGQTGDDDSWLACGNIKVVAPS